MMITYRKFNNDDQILIYNCYNQLVTDFYKKLTFEEFNYNLFLHPEFDENGVYVAEKNNEVIGFITCFVRKIDLNDLDKPGYISTIVVGNDYQKQGIGTKLISLAEEYLKSLNRKRIVFGYLSTQNWPWYIPNTDRHDHNGAPGVRINSELYFYLINHGFNVIDEQDAFHLDLAEFETPKRVLDDLAKLEKEGITIELYDASKHYGLDQFYIDINSEPFERVIRNNLKLDNPYPFAVISDHGKIAGWTGAFYTEPSGRAHFDGIVIAPYIRGKGLGRALFAYLAQYSKGNGSIFMTFFTGRYNFARYIYLSLGFKIIQSFAIMEKEIK